MSTVLGSDPLAQCHEALQTKANMLYTYMISEVDHKRGRASSGNSNQVTVSAGDK